MSNTAKCQLSRAVHSQVGMEDPATVSAAAAIDADFRPWCRGFSRSDVWREIDRTGSTSMHALWEIQGGELRWADRVSSPRCREEHAWMPEGAPCAVVRPDPDRPGETHETGALVPFDQLFQKLWDGLQAAIGEARRDGGEGWAPADVLFAVSVRDDNWDLCLGGPDDEPSCAAPWLTHIRLKGHQEVLVPVMHGVVHEAYNQTWATKKEQAFWHGTNYCPQNAGHLLAGQEAPCTRNAMTELTWRYPQLINITHLIQDNRYLTSADHAEFKYLAQLDGITASYRLHMLMHVDSVILKQDSPWEEYYYRWLRPCVHFVPFFTRTPDDIVDEVIALRQADDFAKELAAASQAFALRHLGQRQRLQYWKAVLERYVALQRQE